MNKDHPELKVYVSNEIIDLQRSIEDKRTVYRTNLQNTTSQPDLNYKGPIREVVQPISFPQPFSSFEKIPKNLYAALPNPQRFKKPKPRTRSKTTDPRFRRSRSPAPQSTASTTERTVNSIPMVSRDEIYISSSYPNLLQEQTHIENVLNNTNEEVAKEALLVQNLEQEETNQEKQITLEKNSEVEITPENTNYDIHTKSEDCNAQTRGPVVAEISPYWYDDRVITKYNNILQQARYRYIPSLPQPSKQTSASHCIANYNWQNCQFPTYNYDDSTEFGEYSYFQPQEPAAKKKQAADVSALPYMMLGCVIGIIMATSLSWGAVKYLDWSVLDIVKWLKYSQRTHHQESNKVVQLLKYVESSVGTIFKTIAWILTIPRDKIFFKPLAEENSEWYTWWKKFI